MHLRYASCVGMDVRETGSEEVLGTIGGILIDPDSGVIEGFFVAVPKFVGSTSLFLSRFDIVRFGAHVYVQDDRVLSLAEDRIRLQVLLSDPRTFLGQRIVTESGRRIGRCADVQFNTESMLVEWLFPRKFWRVGIALPISEVLEVRPDAIVVRDPIPREKAEPVVREENGKPTDAQVVEVAVPT